MCAAMWLARVLYGQEDANLFSVSTGHLKNAKMYFLLLGIKDYGVLGRTTGTLVGVSPADQGQ